MIKKLTTLFIILVSLVYWLPFVNLNTTDITVDAIFTSGELSVGVFGSIAFAIGMLLATAIFLFVLAAKNRKIKSLEKNIRKLTPADV